MRFDQHVASADNYVAFFIDSIPSHVFASIGVARRFQRLGYVVEYWGGRTNRAEGIIKTSGFQYRAVDSLWPRYRDDARLPTHLGFFAMFLHMREVLHKLSVRRTLKRCLSEELQKCERSLDELLQITQPAFIIMDAFLLGYYPILWRRGIATVVLSTKPLPIRDPLVPPYDSVLLPPATLAKRAVVRLCWAKRQVGQFINHSVCRAVSAAGVYTYGDLLRESARRAEFPLKNELVNRCVQPDIHFKSLHEWALWLPETDLPRRKPLPEHTSYIGPSVDGIRASGKAGQWRKAGFRKLIYVAVGTVRFRWRENVEILRKVLKAFADMPDVQVVVSTGDEHATAALQPVPANVDVFDFVPQMEILREADLVITHAGAGTFRECIYHEVPMLAYPRNHDQFGNSSRIVFHGIGLRGDRHGDSEADIREKTNVILASPTFKANLRRLNSIVRSSEEPLLQKALTRLLEGSERYRIRVREERLTAKAVAGNNISSPGGVGSRPAS